MEQKSGSQTVPSKQKKKKKKRGWKFRLFIGIQIIFVILVIAFIGVYFGSGYGFKINALRKDAIEKVRASSEETFRSSQTSVVYDANGNLISTLKGEKDVYYLEYDKIPVYVKTAFVSIEDKKFFKHHGVDYKAILRALLSYVKNKKITQGGSTITQQLSRNVFLSHEVTWERKAEEIFIAMQLEKMYSKTKILEYYINNIYFANGYYGIQAASKGYFNTDVSNLSLSQTAFLCAIPNNPTLYDPLDNMENTLKRRDRILKSMLEDGIIDQTEYDKAVNEEITLNIPVNEKADYVETFIYYCATRALMEQGGFEFQYKFDSDKEREAYEDAYTEAYTTCQKTLFTSGYRIYTSIDMDIQNRLQESIDEQLKDFTSLTDGGIYELQASATCIDNSNGYVKAIVGGRSQTFSGYSLNRAYQSFRQPGSAIKPLIVYTPCLERDYNPNSTVNDSKIKDGPSNSGDKYEGKMTLRRAVAKSKNTVAWRLFQELTPKVGLAYLTDMEFTKIVDDDYYLPSALGGFTKGTSAVEMAGGYAALANDGIYRTPTCIIKIMDADGNEILHSGRDGKRIYKQDAVRMMTDMLVSVIKEGTGKGLGLTNMSAAGKTGTTNDNKDGWFVGYTPYYTTSVWVGYDMPKKLPGLSGSSYPGAIWHQFMEGLHMNLESRDFLAVTTSSDTKKSSSTPTPAPEATQNNTDNHSASQAPASAGTATPEPTQAPEKTAVPTQAPATPKPEPTKTAEPTQDPPEPTATPIPAPTKTPEPAQGEDPSDAE